MTGDLSDSVLVWGFCADAKLNSDCSFHTMDINLGMRQITDIRHPWV